MWKNIVQRIQNINSKQDIWKWYALELLVAILLVVMVSAILFLL
jgi:hypothetical protein